MGRECKHENHHSPGEWTISFIHGRDKAGNYDDIKFNPDISTEFLVGLNNKLTEVPSTSVNVIKKE